LWAHRQLVCLGFLRMCFSNSPVGVTISWLSSQEVLE
jgi:hypothetical protein